MPAADRPDRDRVVPAEHERKRAALRRRPHLLGDSLAGLADLGEEAGFLVAGGHRLADARVDVAPVLRCDPELDEALAQPRVANRGRAHVHAAPACAEVELGPDDRDTPFCVHGGGGYGEAWHLRNHRTTRYRCGLISLPRTAELRSFPSGRWDARPRSRRPPRGFRTRGCRTRPPLPWSRRRGRR